MNIKSSFASKPCKPKTMIKNKWYIECNEDAFAKEMKREQYNRQMENSIIDDQNAPYYWAEKKFLNCRFYYSNSENE